MAVYDAEHPLSGIPPEAWLSGLPLGMISPGQGQGLSGDPQAQGQQGGAGMPGGLSLDELTQLLSQGSAEQQIGPGTDMSLFSGLGAGNLGQAQGYLAGGVPAGTQQQPSQGYVQAGGEDTAGDPLMLIKQALGLVGKGAGIVSQAGRTAGSYPGGYETAGQQSSIDPTGFSLTDEGMTASPEGVMGEALGESPLTGTSSFGDPGLGMLFTRGLLEGSIDPSWVSSLEPAELSSLMAALTTGETSDSVLDVGDFSLGTGGYGTPQAPAAAGTAPEASVPGVVGGAAGGLLGLLNLYGGLKGGNLAQALGGGLGGASGVTSLLQSYPELAQSLGLTSGALGATGTALGGLGGILGLYGGAKALSEGQVPQGITSLLGGGLGTYSALSALYPSVFPALTAGTAGTAGAAGAAGAAGLGAGAGTGAAAGAGAGTGAGIGASAGIAAGAALAAPLFVAGLGPLIHSLASAGSQPGVKRKNEIRNNLVAKGLGGSLLDAIGKSDSLEDFLTIAAAGPGFGQGQVVFDWNGKTGGNWKQQMSPGYVKALLGAASGDPAGIAKFIKGFGVQTGHTGATEKNAAVTDYFRRQMAHAAGLGPKDVAGLFGDFDPTSYQLTTPAAGNPMFGGSMDEYNALLSGGIGKVYSGIGPAAKGRGEYLGVPVSSFYRDRPQLTREQQTTLLQEMELMRRQQEEYDRYMSEGGGS